MALRSGIIMLVGCGSGKDTFVSDGSAGLGVVRFVFELQVARVAVPRKLSAAGNGLLVTNGIVVSA